MLLCVTLCSCLQNQTQTHDTNTAQTAVTEQSDTESSEQTGNAVPPETSVPESSSAQTDPPSVPKPEERVNLVMVGDILMHDPILEYAKTAQGYSFTSIFENIKGDIEKADIAMLNQEVIIGGESHGISAYPKFNSPFELADAIAQAGFDVACHATNHTLDRGAEAMRSCLEYWRKNHPDVTVIGMQDTKEQAAGITVVEKNGIKIAMLNYTYYAINYAGEAAIKKEPYLVNRLIESEVKADLALAEAQADFTVVAVHWGEEYKHTPSNNQKYWARIFLDGGADLVLGTHPHVLQPVEWMEDSDGNRMLVYWSLGNFVNSTAEQGQGIGDRMLGALADVTVTRGDDGKVSITEAFALPLITHIEFKQFGITTYKFSDYTQQMLSRSEAVKKDPTLTMEYAQQHYKDMFGSFIKQ